MGLFFVVLSRRISRRVLRTGGVLVIAAIRSYFDRCAEDRAERLLRQDIPVIQRWQAGVRTRVGLTRKDRANIAALRIERARRMRSVAAAS